MKRILSVIVTLVITITLRAGDSEVLKFDLKFGFLKGGEAVLTITDTSFSNVRAIQYHLEGKTTGITDKLFKVHDTYETIVDAKTNLPLKAIRNIKEKKYRSYNETFFFHDYDSIFSLKSGGRKVPSNLLDIVSIFFYFVKNNYTDKVEKDDMISFPTYHADDIEDVRIKYMGVNTVETDIGKIDCYVLAPWVKKGKLLKRSDGLQCFIAKQDKIPVQFEFDMRVGALRAVIRSYKVNGIERLK